MVERIVPDTSILVEGLLSKRILSNELLPKEIIIHEASLSELEAQANTGREIGLLGLEEIKQLIDLSKKKKFLIRFLGDRPTEHEIANAKRGGIDGLIRNLAFSVNATLVTADRVQALTAQAKGIEVILMRVEQAAQKALSIDKYFDDQTMSVHLKENCRPKAKKGRPGNWQYVELSSESLEKDTIKDIAKEIVEATEIRNDAFIEIERKNSTIIQLGKYRIVITRPPFADGYEITIVRPIKKLNFDEYTMSEKLRERIMSHAEGVLIAGAPGHGKSTFAQALAEFYLSQNKVVKTVEAPRDLVLSDEVTQYAISHATYQEIHDILLLSRPDYTIFDEMRNTDDFELFADLRLAGVGMIGIVHATNPIDAVQRFIGRIELGVIPHVMDTVIFIRNGGVEKIFSVSMEVKVPSGMVEADLARPVVVVNDFETGRAEFEIYSYGEETVVIPVQKGKASSPAAELAGRMVRQEFQRYSDSVKVEMVSNNKATVYVLPDTKSAIIGKGGSNIEQIEKKLGLSIDIRDIYETRDERVSGPSTRTSVSFQPKVDKKGITFMLNANAANKDTDIYVNDEYVVSVKSSKKAIINISKQSPQGRQILKAMNAGDDVELRQ